VKNSGWLLIKPWAARVWLNMPVGMQRVAVGHELAFTRTESPVMAVRFATGNAGLQ